MKNPISWTHEKINSIDNTAGRTLLGAGLGTGKGAVIAATTAGLVKVLALSGLATISAPLSLAITGGIMGGYILKDSIQSSRKKDFKLLRKTPHVVGGVGGAVFDIVSTTGDAIGNLRGKLGKLTKFTSDSIGHLFNGTSNKIEKLQRSQKLKKREEKTKAELLASLNSAPSISTNSAPSISTNSAPSTSTNPTPSNTYQQRAKNTISKSTLPKNKNTSAPSTSTNSTPSNTYQQRAKNTISKSTLPKNKNTSVPSTSTNPTPSNTYQQRAKNTISKSILPKK